MQNIWGSVWIDLFFTVGVPTLYFFNFTAFRNIIFVVFFVAFDSKRKFVLTSISQIRQTLLIKSHQTLNLQNQSIKSVISFFSIVLVVKLKIVTIIKIISAWGYRRVGNTFLAIVRIVINLIVISTNLFVCINNLGFTSD